MRFQLHEKVKYMALGALIALVGFVLGSMTKGINAQSEDAKFEVIEGTLFVTDGIFVGDVVSRSGVHISSEGGGSVAIMDEGELLNIMGVTPEGHSVMTLRSRNGKGGIVLKAPNNSDGVVYTLDKSGKEHYLQSEKTNRSIKPQPKSSAVNNDGAKTSPTNDSRRKFSVDPPRLSDRSSKETLSVGPPRLSDRSSKRPFGVDSQKILNKVGGDIEYKIAVVSDIDLDKSDEGTWYIKGCTLSSYLDMLLFFDPPYPQQNALKDGDFIAFSAKRESLFIRGEEIYYFNNAKILDYISSQSVKVKIDNINIRNLSTPSKEIPPFARAEDFVNVTGVIMAVEIIENVDPEPDNPSDYLINRAVMKCADRKLYLVNFDLANPMLEFYRPSQGAFGEGDVVTVTQMSSVRVNDYTFEAYHKKRPFIK